MPLEAGGSLPRPFRRRSRRGCLTCRQHRSKCDEKSPKCGNCNRLDRHCRWGLQASFHPSRISKLSASDSISLSEIESNRQNLHSLAFIDESREIEQQYERHAETAIQLESTQRIGGDATQNTFRQVVRHCPGNDREVPVADSIPASIHKVSERALDTDISGSQLAKDSESIQCLHTRPPLIPGRPIYSASNNFSLIHGNFQQSSARNGSNLLPPGVLTWPINDHKKAKLLLSYFQTTSTWCEVTDSSKPFSTLWGHRLLESQAFAAAAIALASASIWRRTDASSLLATELYNFAREVLQQLESENLDATLLATTILCLCSSAMDKPVEEQSILHECAHLLQTSTLNNVSDDVLSACFWAFARQDIWAAHSSHRSTLTSIETWSKFRDLLPHGTAQDSYNNRAIYITARLVNELSKNSIDFKATSLYNLWTELQMWVIERPPNVRCVMEVEASGDLAFPTILFSNPSAVCGNVFYHVACILLLTQSQFCDELSAMASPICHARRIAGISITNNEHANLVNNTYPLYIAACYLSASVERIAISKHLQKIEEITGCGTKKYVNDLERLWGL